VINTVTGTKEIPDGAIIVGDGTSAVVTVQAVPPGRSAPFVAPSPPDRPAGWCAVADEGCEFLGVFAAGRGSTHHLEHHVLALSR
jgi:hypothetical protein